MWKYFEFEVNGKPRLYRAKLDGQHHANPVSGLIAEYKHEKYGWRTVNNYNRKADIYKELKQYQENGTLNKPGVLGLAHQMFDELLVSR